MDHWSSMHGTVCSCHLCANVPITRVMPGAQHRQRPPAPPQDQLPSIKQPHRQHKQAIRTNCHQSDSIHATAHHATANNICKPSRQQNAGHPRKIYLTHQHNMHVDAERGKRDVAWWLTTTLLSNRHLAGTQKRGLALVLLAVSTLPYKELEKGCRLKDC